jgi:hypothetical protein
MEYGCLHSMTGKSRAAWPSFPLSDDDAAQTETFLCTGDGRVQVTDLGSMNGTTIGCALACLLLDRISDDCSTCVPMSGDQKAAVFTKTRVTWFTGACACSSQTAELLLHTKVLTMECGISAGVRS